MSRLLLLFLLTAPPAWASFPADEPEAPALAAVKPAKGAEVDAAVAKLTGVYKPKLGEVEQKQVDLVRMVTGDTPVTDAQLAALGLDEAQLVEARALRDEMAGSEAARRQARMALQALDGLTITIEKGSMSLSGMDQVETVTWFVERLDADAIHIVVTKGNGLRDRSVLAPQPDGSLKVFERGLLKLHLERR